MATVTATEARTSLPELLDRVEAGEEFTITRHGRAIATLIRPDALVSRRADTALAAADRVRQLLAKGRATDLGSVPALTAEQAEKLAVALGAAYRFRAVDAVHLATAVGCGAERFITNSRKDFRTDIAEIAVTHPEALPEP